MTKPSSGQSAVRKLSEPGNRNGSKLHLCTQLATVEYRKFEQM